MISLDVITFCIGAWLLGYLWGFVANVITKKFTSWLS